LIRPIRIYFLAAGPVSTTYCEQFVATQKSAEKDWTAKTTVASSHVARVKEANIHMHIESARSVPPERPEWVNVGLMAASDGATRRTPAAVPRSGGAARTPLPA